MKPEEFEKHNSKVISEMSKDISLKAKTLTWFNQACKHEYSYHFSWMGIPIIQFPQDMIAMQEIIWRTKPDLLIETGIARGGSLIFYASLMELMGKGHILGIDIDIRNHNRSAIESHPMSKRITMFEGSSVEDDMVQKVASFAKDYKTIMVCLDSNHTHEHVLSELNAYNQFVTSGNYLVVFDSILEFMDDELSAHRPWGKGNNPYTAIHEFLRSNQDFEIDQQIDNKLQVSVAPNGYLIRQ